MQICCEMYDWSQISNIIIQSWFYLKIPVMSLCCMCLPLLPWQSWLIFYVGIIWTVNCSVPGNSVFMLYIMLDLSKLLWTGSTHSLSILLLQSWHAVHRMKQVLFNPVSCLEVSFIKAVDGHSLVVLFLSIPCEHPVTVWNQWIYLRNKRE